MTGPSVRPLRALAEVALGRQRSPQHETGEHLVPYLRAANVQDGRIDISDVKEMNFDPREQEVYALRPGDVLVSEGAGSLSAVGASAVWRGELDGTVCFQNTLLRVRPRPGVNAGFLEWWCRHAHASGLFAAVASGVNIFHLGAERVRALPIRAPDARDQRSIADFLDSETARIDALIAMKRRWVRLLEERRQSAAESLMRSDRQVPLRRIADLLPGYMFSSDDFGPEADGPLLLRGVNVAVGSIRWNDVVRLEARCTIPERYRLVESDLVVGMDRPFIGGGTRVALIDEKSAGALLVQRVCRIRASSSADAILIEHLLRSPRFVAHVEPDLTGVSVPHLSDEQIGSMLVPVFERPVLERSASRLLAIAGLTAALMRRLEQQVVLLQERRQALITAAVTGEMKVA